MTSGQALIKYAFNIRLFSKSYGFQAAKMYDENFRKVKKLLNFKWEEVNDELWRSAVLSEKSNNFPGQSRSSNIRVRSNIPTFQRKVQHQYQFPNGYCWAFCKSGECTANFCKLKHQCVHCSKKHCTLTCPEGKKNKQSVSAKTSNPSKG